ncbi:aldose epimerase family protein [Sunxiuqinia rutila]|uniref:aldose epimerase family protein n=1 Tax=Sunxiuqinia rutila TaxID=1397841 RepID=UPI003D35E18D
MKKLAFLFLIAGIACQQPAQKKEDALYAKADFESTIDGKTTTLYTLENAHGMKVTLTNYGAKIVSILVPDREGKLTDVALGFKSIAEYQTQDAGQGAVVGPYANRIANAQFELNGEVYKLEVNNHKANLHSGTQSFYRQVYEAKELKTADGPAVAMTLISPDGASGFPGNKEVTVTYTLTDKNELKIDYQATTDKACPFNLTNHVYFNLKGEGNGDILDHIVVIDADSTTEVLNNELIPTGKIVSIKGTDMDFSTPHAVGERIDSDMPALAVAGGYDHNYILNKDQEANELTFCASVYEPKSGRYMEVFTTEPAVQFYTGNFLNGTLTGRSGKTYEHRYGLCLETQHYPDSPNHPNFPNTVLEPGDTLNSTTIYKFSVKNN